MSQLLEDLKASRQALEEREWIRWGLYGTISLLDDDNDDLYEASYNTDECCALGAVFLATGRNGRDGFAIAKYGDRNWERGNAVRDALEAAIPPDSLRDVATFNDRIAQSKADVLALFDAAIAKEEFYRSVRRSAIVKEEGNN